MVTSPQFLMAIDIKAKLHKLIEKESFRVINLDQEKDALIRLVDAIVDDALTTVNQPT